MKLLIDDADVTKIRQLMAFYPIDGVTTNPTIVSRTGRPPYEVLKEIRDILGPDRELHIQACGKDPDKIVAEAHRIVKEIPGNTFIKIPCLPYGFAAMQRLTAEGIQVTGTTIYAPMQAYLAAKSGARYVAPYVTNIANLGYDGVAVALQIQELLMANDFECELLGAGFCNSQQVLDLCVNGVGSCTLPSELFESLTANACVDQSVELFLADFAAAYGAGKDMETV